MPVDFSPLQNAATLISQRSYQLMAQKQDRIEELRIENERKRLEAEDKRNFEMAQGMYGSLYGKRNSKDQPSGMRPPIGTQHPDMVLPLEGQLPAGQAQGQYSYQGSKPLEGQPSGVQQQQQPTIEDYLSGETKWNDKNLTPEALKILSKLKTYKEEWISNPITPEEERKNYTVVFKTIKDKGLENVSFEDRLDIAIKFAGLGVVMEPDWLTKLFSGENFTDRRRVLEGMSAEMKVNYGDSWRKAWMDGDLNKLKLEPEVINPDKQLDIVDSQSKITHKGRTESWSVWEKEMLKDADENPMIAKKIAETALNALYPDVKLSKLEKTELFDGMINGEIDILDLPKIMPNKFRAKGERTSEEIELDEFDKFYGR